MVIFRLIAVAHCLGSSLWLMASKLLLLLDAARLQQLPIDNCVITLGAAVLALLYWYCCLVLFFVLFLLSVVAFVFVFALFFGFGFELRLWL